MDANPRRIVVYWTAFGKSPFQEWFDSLRNRDTGAEIMVALSRIESGNLGHSKPVGKGVQEVKISHGPGYRVYFGFDGPVVVVLLCGGDKSKQRSDIAKAVKYWKDFSKRRKTNAPNH